MKVRLVTSPALGNELVHETEIPTFNEPPRVVGWGDRVFQAKHLELDGALFNTAVKASGQLAADIGARGIFIYEEVFAYAIVT